MGGMKRFELKFDGADAGYVYADTGEAARRSAWAAYKRVHPDRDPTGRVRVAGDGDEVDSEASEARRLVAEVYEGLRLLPGMELPAEKLRGAVLLLESAVAREGGSTSLDLAARGGGGGDTELLEALEPIFSSKAVPKPVTERIRGLVEWVGVNTPAAERRQIELRIFQALWEAGLIDATYADPAPCPLYRASAFLATRLVQAGGLRIERLSDVADVDALAQALAPFGEDAAVVVAAFRRDRSGPAPVEALQPLVLVGGRRLQPAHLLRGSPCDDEEVLAFDRALFDAHQRLRSWRAGLGRLAEALADEQLVKLLERTQKRIEDARQRMAQGDAGPTPPSDTARRDLVKFLIDQVHRIGDALSLLPDMSLREAYNELVFKDIVFRGAGTYLTQRFGLQVDTDVVAGANSEALVGRFKPERSGARPRIESPVIHSVVVPCYTQGGAVVRPATVRLGLY